MRNNWVSCLTYVCIKGQYISVGVTPPLQALGNKPVSVAVSSLRFASAGAKRVPLARSAPTESSLRQDATSAQKNPGL